MITIPTIILILNICLFISGVFLLSKTASNFKRPEVRWLAIFIGALCIVAFGGMNVYIQDSLEAKIFFSRFRFLGLSILAQSWFFFITITFSGHNFLQKKWILSLLALPTMVTMALVLVPAWGNLLTTNYSIITWDGARLVSFSHGPWFKFHIIWCYLFAFAGIIYTFCMLPKLDYIGKTQILTLTLGGVISSAVDIYCVITDSPLRWAMISGAGYLISIGVILYGVIKLGLLDLSTSVKNEIFNKISDPILILDQKNRLIEFNNSASTIFFLKKDCIDRPFSEIKLFHLLSLEEDITEWKYLDPNGALRYFEVIAEKINSQLIQKFKIIRFHEFTNRKQAELLLSNNLEFKARIVSMIAHDFSNVIQNQTILSSSLELEVAPELREQAGVLTDSTHISKDFMNNILLWARTQKNKFEPTISSFELNTLVRDVVNSIESLWKLRGLKLNITSSHSPIILKGDSIMIESVVRNILTNAIRASSSGQNIDILVEENQAFAKVSIKDQGIGLTDELLKAIQKNSSMSYSVVGHRTEGFGLGISIAQKFVELHHGSLEFESEIGQGTLVTLALPL